VSVPRERLVYDLTVESMFSRALKGRLSSRVRARVKEAGIDLDAKLKPAYPREVWLRAMRIVVEELYEGVPEERAWLELGERLVISLGETVMGSATLSILKLLGPSPGGRWGGCPRRSRPPTTTTAASPRVELAEFDGQQCTYAITF
jgi:hypothetical protein